MINLAENIKCFTFVPDPNNEFYHVDMVTHGVLIAGGHVEETEALFETYKYKDDIPLEFCVTTNECPYKENSALARIAAARAERAERPDLQATSETPSRNADSDSVFLHWMAKWLTEARRLCAPWLNLTKRTEEKEWFVMNLFG